MRSAWLGVSISILIYAINMDAMTHKECQQQRLGTIASAAAVQLILPHMVCKTLLKKDFMNVSRRIKIFYALYAGLSGSIFGEQLFRQTSASQFLMVEKKHKLLIDSKLRSFVHHVFSAPTQNLALFYKDVQRIYRQFDVPLVTCYKRLEKLNQESEYIKDTIYGLQKNMLINQGKRNELLDERLHNALEAKKTIQAAMHALKNHPRWQEEFQHVQAIERRKKRELIEIIGSSGVAK